MIPPKGKKVNRDEAFGRFLLSSVEKNNEQSRQMAGVAKTIAKFAKDSWDKIDAFLKEVDSRVTKRLAELKDGYTPQKGVDYFDGNNGYTPVKGKDYFDGEDGEDADEERVKNAVLAEIKVPTVEDIQNNIPVIGERVRDSLELLQGDERLDKSAIKGLDEELKRISEIRGQTRGGGTSAIGVRQAFKYIAHTEQPTGAINGSNVTYTVKNDIFWIAGFTLNGEQIAQIPNFTVSGRTITFATALPSAYSGKDFEVKYIG